MVCLRGIATFVVISLGLPALASADLNVWAYTWPSTFEMYSQIDIEVDVSSPFGVCETDESLYVEVNGTNGFYSWWETNYRTHFYFYDRLYPRSPNTISYSAYAQFSTPCGGDDSGWALAWSDPAPPRPASLSVITEQYTELADGGCDPGMTGGCTRPPWTYIRRYQVMNNWGGAYAQQLSVFEDFTQLSNTCPGNLRIVSTGHPGVPTDFNGQFVDRFWMCSPVCCSGGWCNTVMGQTWYGEGYYLKQFTNDFRCDYFVIFP